MTTDKMREDFEAWAKSEGFDISRLKLNNFDSSDYAHSLTSAAEDGYEAGYAAGRDAEREAICIQWEGADATIAEVERLRAMLVNLAIPVEALLLDEGSHKYIAPTVLAEIQASLKETRKQMRGEDERR